MSLMVGISGVRGIVGQTLTPEVALTFAQAYGTLLGGGQLVLARDTRPSGAVFEAAAAAGLMATGCDVTRLGVAMTPTIGRAIRDGGYVGGMSITASHNPIEWNGLKFLDDLGVAPDADKAKRIAEIRERGAYALVRSGFGALERDDGAGARHVEAVVRAMDISPGAVRGTHVVLDSINGAGCEDTPPLLERLGCRLTHINAEPTGAFAHRPEPTRENLGQLCEAVRASGADVGFAQDPDADRLAIVDERGEYIGEEYSLALAMEHVLSRRPGPVAANLSTSRMVDVIASKHGVPVLRTPVGESNVARAMLAHDCVIGGEGNGGVIDPRVCHVRDSLSAMSLVLQLMSASGRRVSELVAGLPRFVSVKQKYEVSRERIDAAVAAVVSAYADRKPNVADGVRVDFDAGWVHLRASNTEPIVRLIAEGESEDAVATLVGQVREVAGL
jgi:phosphomannomutase